MEQLLFGPIPVGLALALMAAIGDVKIKGAPGDLRMRRRSWLLPLALHAVKDGKTPEFSFRCRRPVHSTKSSIDQDYEGEFEGLPQKRRGGMPAAPDDMQAPAA
jgi:hypothetical protein